ncbi:MAG: hypothetical protein KAS32_12425 [Candidatus Peribacteraceae bacterium]|nr:hypothetical protein [Candidatus Peribacteraceae bacterium]
MKYKLSLKTKVKHLTIIERGKETLKTYDKIKPSVYNSKHDELDANIGELADLNFALSKVKNEEEFNNWLANVETMIDEVKVIIKYHPSNMKTYQVTFTEEYTATVIHTVKANSEEMAQDLAETIHEGHTTPIEDIHFVEWLVDSIGEVIK